MEFFKFETCKSKRVAVPYRGTISRALVKLPMSGLGKKTRCKCFYISNSLKMELYVGSRAVPVSQPCLLVYFPYAGGPWGPAGRI